MLLNLFTINQEKIGCEMNNIVVVKTLLGSFGLDISLKLEKGINCLFGPSGSGKTSIINCIAGLVKPDNSFIDINNTLLNNSKENYFLPIHRRKIGYVFQDSRLFPHFSVKKNLLYGKSFSAENKFDFETIVDILELKNLLTRYPYNLSGGEKQRVSFGRALLSQPNIILMDEPLVSLDQEKKNDLIDYIKKIDKKFNMPIIYVSHSISETFILGKQINFIRSGKITFSGNKQQALDYYNNKYSLSSKNSFIKGKVEKIIKSSGLTQLKIGKNKLLIYAGSLKLDSEVIVKIRSSDIIISKSMPTNISSLNFLKVFIKDIKVQGKLILFILKHENEVIKAHITMKSFQILKLKKKDTCYALIKAVNINDVYKVSFI